MALSHLAQLGLVAAFLLLACLAEALLDHYRPATGEWVRVGIVLAIAVAVGGASFFI